MKRHTMKRPVVIFVLMALSFGVLWAAYQAAGPAEHSLASSMPAGALLYLEGKDFSGLLSNWKSSREKSDWIKSQNYEQFSRSRLFLRLESASSQFATAAGLPPNMDFLTQVAGERSALAIYDIGKLQFLYITHLPSAQSLQTTLWQSRANFETRSAGGTTFYLRRDPESEKEVEFAVAGEYLLLATREDLMAGALALMAAGNQGNPQKDLAGEAWWRPALAAAGPAGDLRMVLNLEKIVPTPYFRSYWVQQNITEMKQYSAAVSDLYRTGPEYREERVLLRKAAGPGPSSEGAQAAADLARLVPEQAGVYAVKADPSKDSSFDLLETKLLAPHFGAAPAAQIAPAAPLPGENPGSASDLETRIDQAVTPRASSNPGEALQSLLEKHAVQAALQTQATEADKDGVFVRIHSLVALAGSGNWDEAEVRSALANFVRPALTASELGTGWQQKNGYQEMDGLHPLLVAVQGKYLLVSDDAAMMTAALANMKRKTDAKPAALIAGFSHQSEREHFARFFSLIDRPNAGSDGEDEDGRPPQFFSENIVSLSSALAEVSSQKIVVRDSGDKVQQSVVYAWAK
ncbi:MAG: hypothetical protein JST79_18650 [Acidobacteria bacterium]|nr:hypothetical protein [Acidobacteriota bacterium]